MSVVVRAHRLRVHPTIEQAEYPERVCDGVRCARNRVCRGAAVLEGTGLLHLSPSPLRCCPEGIAEVKSSWSEI